MIDPNNITTIRVDQLPTAVLNVGNEFAHSQGTDLKKATIQDLVDIVSVAVGVGTGVGFLPISVTDGQQLPSVPADPSFFLCGPGTYLNINGFPDIICTEELNAVMSLSDHWGIAVEIPINSSVVISQNVTEGVTNKTPSENAVFNAINEVDLNKVLTVNNQTGGKDIALTNNDKILLDNGANLKKGTTDSGLGGSKGIALRCAVDYELKWEAGRLYVMGGDGFTIREVSHNFTTTPTVNDDSTKGFDIGSRWILDNGDVYVCEDDNEASAIWELQTIGGGVPYTGATQDVDLGEFGLLTGNIEFDNTPTNIPTNAGSMVWNDTDGTLDLKLKGGNVTLQIGQEQVLRVVNKTATNINLLEANYQAVRVTGAQGQRLKVDLAQATNDLLSAETIGLVTETINNNQEGFITTSGLIRGVNTTGSLQSETWADGDILYLSPTVAGKVTKVKPVAPNHLVIIGYVVYAHATQGSIFVKVDNGYELDELHNVKIATPLNNNILAYTSATEIWENKTVDAILGGTPVTGGGLTGQIAYFASNGSVISGREIAEATTGAVISFAMPQVYNTFTSPTNLDITASLGTAKIGVVQKIYSNKSVEPTYPSGWKKLSGTYTNAVTNIIYAEWCEGSRVEYWIVKATV